MLIIQTVGWVVIALSLVGAVALYVAWPSRLRTLQRRLKNGSTLERAWAAQECLAWASLMGSTDRSLVKSWAVPIMKKAVGR